MDTCSGFFFRDELKQDFPHALPATCSDHSLNVRLSCFSQIENLQTDHRIQVCDLTPFLFGLLAFVGIQDSNRTLDIASDKANFRVSQSASQNNLPITTCKKVDENSSKFEPGPQVHWRFINF